MKTLIRTLLIAAFPVLVMADDVPGILIAKKDGSTISVDISSIRNIKFTNGEMQITQTINNGRYIRIDEISELTFASISTAISALAADCSNSVLTVTDMTGRIIFQGKADNYKPGKRQKGIYISTINGISHKVSIK